MCARGGFDRVADALANRNRRAVLAALVEDAPRNVSDLLHDDIQLGEGAQRRALALRHNHLPRLEAHGYLRWEPETGTIHRGPRWEEVEPVVRLLANNQDRLPDDTF